MLGSPQGVRRFSGRVREPLIPTPTAWSVWALALGLYLLIAVMTTWPVAANPSGTVFGTPGDMTGNITLLRYRNELGVGPLSNAVTPQEAAPFGVTLPGALSLPQVMVEGPAQLLAAITGNAVLAVNLMIIAGLALTAFACFALCISITGNAWASGVAGLGYGFNPWILERAHGHIHFTHLWSLPVVILALLWIRRGGRTRAWALLAASLLVACYTNTYVSLFAAVIVGAFVVADLLAAAVRRNGRVLRAAASRSGFSIGLLIAVMIPQAIVSVTQASRIDGLLAGTRSPFDAYTYGSRWWEWITPSYRHAIFGEWTAPFLAARQHDSNLGETALYLGSLTLALAVVGAAVTLVARRRGRPAWAGALALVIVAVGLMVSLPRGISPFGFEIPMPSAVLSQVVEPWRVYSRLFAVVALGVAMLAAIGLARLLASVPRSFAPVAAMAVGAIVAYDLSMVSTSFSASPPPVYRALGDLPGDDPRAEYPLARPIEAPHLAYIFYTEAAGRPLMNGGRAGSASGSFSGRMQDPAAPWTAPALAGLGTRWIVMHSHIYGGAPPVPGAGYRLVGDFEGSLLYEVTAGAPAMMAVPGDGFGVPEVRPDGRFAQWLETDKGSITIINTTGRTQPVTITFTVGSFYREREVRFVADGAEIASRTVGDDPEQVRIQLAGVEPGRSDVDVIATPGPDPIGPLTGSLDPRMLSIQIGGITARADRGPAFRVG